MSVVIETTIGDVTVDLYTKERPKSCLNFLKLCKLKRYNLNLFHVIQPEFIAQTGDPLGTGKGGESVYGDLYGHQAKFYEAETNPRIKHTKKGLISMVNYGNGMLGSQFFFTLGEDLDYLDGEHCVFGEIVEGWETLNKINGTICDGSNRPYQDIRITHTVILHDPYEDPSGFEPRADSPEPTSEILASSRIGADENINEYAGKTNEEINEMLASKEEKARAAILEMVGDLPDANVAPPENVLFVCKLNPVTNDDDLEIIFSRFGKVKMCEVIRDRKSQESLQYAFVEFEEQSSCEQAYFKMDNVLIDDRRIHVDFSQSVSKYQWKGKGRLEILDEKAPDPGKENKKDKVDLKSNPDAARVRRARSKSQEARKIHRDRSRSRDKKRRSRSRDPVHQHNKHRNEYYRERSRDKDDRNHSKKDDRGSKYDDRRRGNDDDRRVKDDRREKNDDRRTKDVGRRVKDDDRRSKIDDHRDKTDDRRSKNDDRSGKVDDRRIRDDDRLSKEDDRNHKSHKKSHRSRSRDHKRESKKVRERSYS